MTHQTTPAIAKAIDFSPQNEGSIVADNTK